MLIRIYTHISVALTSYIEANYRSTHHIFAHIYAFIHVITLSCIIMSIYLIYMIKHILPHIIKQQFMLTQWSPYIQYMSVPATVISYILIANNIHHIIHKMFHLLPQSISFYIILQLTSEWLLCLMY